MLVTGYFSQTITIKTSEKITSQGIKNYQDEKEAWVKGIRVRINPMLGKSDVDMSLRNYATVSTGPNDSIPMFNFLDRVGEACDRMAQQDPDRVKIQQIAAMVYKDIPPYHPIIKPLLCVLAISAIIGMVGFAIASQPVMWVGGVPFFFTVLLLCKTGATRKQIQVAREIDTLLLQLKRCVPEVNLEILLSENEIIDRLRKQGFTMTDVPRDCRCLFHVFAGQLSEQDMRHYEDWASRNDIEKANFLRQIAMEREDAFMKKFQDGNLPSEEMDITWINEFYKDMQQEFGAPKNRVRELSKTVPFNDKFQFVLSNFARYRSETARERCFAGTTEAIALSTIFERDVIFYGQDTASQEQTTVNEKGEVLPYFSSNRYPNSSPIYIFQSDRASHYQLLKKVRT